MWLCEDRHAVKPDGDLTHLLGLSCRSWSCETCAPGRRRRLMADAMAGNPEIFLTITAKPIPNTPPASRARELARAWPTVRRRAKAEAVRDPAKRPTPRGPRPPGGWPRDDHGRVPRQVELRDGELPFLAVFEATKLGNPHLHILVRARWIGQQWLSAQMGALLASPVCWVERCDSRAKASAYVAKYCGKAPHRFATCKRYWASKDWRQEAAPDERPVADAGRWHVERGSAWAEANKLCELGFVIVAMRHRLITVQPGRGPP